MNLGSYLKDRIVSIACWGCVLVISCKTLSTTQMPPSIVELVALMMAFGLVIDLAVGYAGHRRFWQTVATIANESRYATDDTSSVEKTSTPQIAHSPLDAAQDLPYPTNTIERLTDAALVSCAQAAADGIARSRREAEDYRTFVEAWSHEVKTPIHTATLLAASDPSSTGQAITGELERVDAYVEQALYYARSTSVERDFSVRENDLRAIVTDALHQRTSLLLSQGVRLDLENLDFQVLCDAKWVRFMLGQLIDNACKYASPNRPQSLRFSARRSRAGTANEHITLSVTDRGMGIPSHDLPRIFDKGFVGENGRRSEQAASTGIGLYLVQTLAQKTGLKLSVRSKVDEGTVFEIEFPVNRFHYLDDSSA